MRAMRLWQQAPPEQSPLQWQRLDDPEPGPGQLRLRVLACGVCHTDLHIVRGDLPLRVSPLIPGHQIVGCVEAVGQGVAGPDPGSRVGVTWLSEACGCCEQCVAGRENLCREGRFTGYDRDGGFADKVIVPASAALPLPAGFSDADAAPLLCAGIIGYRSLRLSHVRPGERLGLFGFGASAHLTLQVARARNCEVFVFSRSERHRRLALDLGAAWAGSVEQEAPARLHAAISFAPVGWLVPQALRRLERGGTLAINAIHMDRLPELDYREHLYWERSVCSVTNLTRQDGREFFALAERLDLRVITEVFPLRQANEVLSQLQSSRLSAAAVLIPDVD